MPTNEQILGIDDSKLVNFKDDPRRMSVLMADRDAAKALGPLFMDAYEISRMFRFLQPIAVFTSSLKSLMTSSKVRELFLIKTRIQ